MTRHPWSASRSMSGKVVRPGVRRRRCDPAGSGRARRPRGRYDAAVVSDDLPDAVRAGVVFTLPDTRGSGGTGSVRRGEIVEEVDIAGAERVVELLQQYA